MQMGVSQRGNHSSGHGGLSTYADSHRVWYVEFDFLCTIMFVLSHDGNEDKAQEVNPSTNRESKSYPKLRQSSLADMSSPPGSRESKVNPEQTVNLNLTPSPADMSSQPGPQESLRLISVSSALLSHCN
jgi:hypothetical protein